MRNSNVSGFESRVESDLRSSLDDLLREGARRMLQSAIEAEVAEHIDRHKEICDDAGHRLVVRNGSLPERDIVSGVGPLRVRQPRVHDRRESHRFTSRILPPFMRRVPSIDALIPALYLSLGIPSPTGSQREKIGVNDGIGDQRSLAMTVQCKGYSIFHVCCLSQQALRLSLRIIHENMSCYPIDKTDSFRYGGFSSMLQCLSR